MASALTALTSGACGTRPAEQQKIEKVSSALLTSNDLYVVAHPDDDLLFINPDVQTNITAGRAVRTVYVTSGDGGGPASWWQSRETGMRAAYARMANVANTWTCATRAYATKNSNVCTLTARPNISLVFMRLPDGQIERLWARVTGPPLWVSPVTSLTTIDSTTSYTWQELINSLVAIMTETVPGSINSTDSTLAYGPDHRDRVTTGLFALEAAHRYGGEYDFRIYRGNTIYQPWFAGYNPEPVNLTQAQRDAKATVAQVSTGTFAVNSEYDRWSWRKYGIGKILDRSSAVLAGTLTGPGGNCLTVATTGAVSLAACNAATTQRWTLALNQQIQTATGTCLTAGTGETVSATTCAATPSQKWTLFENGQLRGIDGRCLSGSGTTASLRYCEANTATNPPSVATAQRYTFTGSGTAEPPAAPVTPTITTTSPVTTGATGLTASVVARAGMTYVWTIAGGTITSAGGTAGVTSGATNTITFTAGATGTLALTAREVNAGGTSSASATANVTVNPTTPVAPTITAPTQATTGATGLTASVVARSGMSYVWTITGGTITSAGGTAGVTAGTTNTITFTAGAAGTLALTARESNGSTTSAAANASVNVLAAPIVPAITAPTSVTEGQTGVVASVVARAGMTYLWTITNGTITSAGGTAGVTSGSTNSITFTAGTAGTVALTAVERNAAGAASAAGSRSVTVTPPPAGTPVITAPAIVTSGRTGLQAYVTARTGMTYLWTISGGTITSSGGTAGVTSGGRNTITFTAGAAGTLSLTCTERSGSTSGVAGGATVSVVGAPTTPAISAPTSADRNQAGLTASVPARAGMSYAWTINGGTITSAGGASGVTSGSTNSITFTAGTGSSVDLSCVERNAAGDSGGTASASLTVNGPAAPSGGRLQVVAHPDDDLLFVNPDIHNGIAAGNAHRTVYITSGDAGGVDWQNREQGVLNAYAAMASVPSSWACAATTYAGRTTRRCTLNGRTNVSLVFLRLRDGNMMPLWAPSTGAPFWVNPISSMATVDGAATYSRTDVVATLTAIINESAPAIVGTLDHSMAYGSDHPDHIASAFFALEAIRNYGNAQEVRLYRGYTIYEAWMTEPAPEAVNLSSAQHAEKVRIMGIYDNGNPPAPDDVYDRWCWRQYSVANVTGGPAPLRANGGCLATTGGAGSTPTTASCSGAAAQQWTVESSGAVRSSGGLCLALGANGSSLTVATCNGSTAQRWVLFANGQLRGNEGRCVTTQGSGSTPSAEFCESDQSAARFRPVQWQSWSR